MRRSSNNGDFVSLFSHPSVDSRLSSASKEAGMMSEHRGSSCFIDSRHSLMWQEFHAACASSCVERDRGPGVTECGQRSVWSAWSLQSVACSFAPVRPLTSIPARRYLLLQVQVKTQVSALTFQGMVGIKAMDTFAQCQSYVYPWWCISILICLNNVPYAAICIVTVELNKGWSSSSFNITLSILNFIRCIRDDLWLVRYMTLKQLTNWGKERAEWCSAAATSTKSSHLVGAALVGAKAGILTWRTICWFLRRSEGWHSQEYEAKSNSIVKCMRLRCIFLVPWWLYAV